MKEITLGPNPKKVKFTAQLISSWTSGFEYWQGQNIIVNIY